jgi:adenosylcobinamide kinase / adenosylcobinamide-phosphate guanylyltransferase
MAAAPLSRLTLVLGGARSGKSAYAEGLVRPCAPPWTYLATAQAFDDEMRARIDQHRGRRDARWQTIEAPLELVEAISAPELPRPLLIDCLTLWLSNILLAGADLTAASDRLIDALAAANGPIVAVSNEVGLGIVPDTPLGRQFRDAQGWLNQRVAAVADRVVLLAAGLPLTLK